MALDQGGANVVRPVAGRIPFIQLRRGGGEDEVLLFSPVPANLPHLRIVAVHLPAAADYLPRCEHWCALGQVFETINQLPVQVWNLLLDDVHDHVAHVPWRIRPGPRLAIATGLQCEHVAALAFRLLTRPA